MINDEEEEEEEEEEDAEENQAEAESEVRVGPAYKGDGSEEELKLGDAEIYDSANLRPFGGSDG